MVRFLSQTCPKNAPLTAPQDPYISLLTLAVSKLKLVLRASI